MRTKKPREYMIRPPAMRDTDPTNKFKRSRISKFELDEIFGGELCQINNK